MLNPDETLIGLDGQVYVGPTDATVPTDATTTPDAAFVDVGYIANNGVRVAPTINVGSVEALQSFYPIRRWNTSKEALFHFDMQQHNAVTTQLAFGGGTVTGLAPDFLYTPPDPRTIDEHSFIFDIEDGAKITRWYLPRGLVTALGEVAYGRTAPSVLACSVSLLGPVGTAPEYLRFIHDPDFETV